MSGVELPQVGSARASSSGSSSHRSLNSAGSNTSSRRLTCANEYDQEGDENDGEEEDDDDPPEETSQGGLWDEVEQFLNKPPPSFGAIAKGVDSKSITSTGSRLPTLLKSECKPEQSRSSGNQTKGRGAAMKTGISSSKPIDPKLLEEAFAYAAHVQRQNMDDMEEEGDEQQQQHRQTSSGILRQDSFGSVRVTPQELKKQRKAEETKPKKKKNSNSSNSHSAYGAPLKPPVKKKTGTRNSSSSSSSSITGNGWDSSSSSADPNNDGIFQSRNSFSSSSSSIPANSSIDPQTLQSLVSNFQNGTTLDELRRELAASQQSIAASRQVIQEAAKTFFKTT